MAIAPKGTKHHAAKVTDGQVRKIRKLKVTSNYSNAKLGRMFGLCHTCIGDIV